MNITILADNNTIIDSYFLGEPGLSILIEDGNETILFDCGYSDVFIRNAVKRKKDLSTIDHLIISHNHLDHTWGLQDLIRLLAEERFEGRSNPKPSLITHPETFTDTKVPGIGSIGSMIPIERITDYFIPRLSREPVRITEHCTFLGEIPRTCPFEPTPAIGFKEGSQEPDSIPDDSAIVYQGSEGLVIITGCSHAGICNIIEYAKQVTGEERVIDIIGGLHLIDAPDEQITATADYLKGLGLTSLHACHCTGLRALAALFQVVPVQETGSGMIISYP